MAITAEIVFAAMKDFRSKFPEDAQRLRGDQEEFTDEQLTTRSEVIAKAFNGDEEALNLVKEYSAKHGSKHTEGDIANIASCFPENVRDEVKEKLSKFHA